MGFSRRRPSKAIKQEKLSFYSTTLRFQALNLHNISPLYDDTRLVTINPSSFEFLCGWVLLFPYASGYLLRRSS
jgi:hypothetical protein